MQTNEETKTQPTPLTRQPGCGLAVGQTSQGQLELRREQPLMEKQLTAIASHLQLKPLSLTSKIAKTYGRKFFPDEFGGFWVEGEPTGTEETVEIAFVLDPNAPIGALEAALRLSPPAANMRHLAHLALHKRLGSSQEDRAVLLADYAQVLQQFPEFVVWTVCKALWQETENAFFPKIKKINDICESVVDKLEAKLEQMRALAENNPRIAQGPKVFEPAPSVNREEDLEKFNKLFPDGTPWNRIDATGVNLDADKGKIGFELPM